ncbi:MAG: translation elongation factor Ts [Actinomycetota bacterium]
MTISAAEVKELRDATGAGMMDCKKALQESDGDLERATEILREKGLASVAKRAGRAANQGLIEAYVHFNNSVGVLIEVNCETDFVAKTEGFVQLVKDLCQHIAFYEPRWIARDEVPAQLIEAERHVFEVQAKEAGKPEQAIPKIVEGKLEKFFKDVGGVLLDQPFIKDDKQSVGELVDATSAKLGEKVAVRRFVRYKLGEESE